MYIQSPLVIKTFQIPTGVFSLRRWLDVYSPALDNPSSHLDVSSLEIAILSPKLDVYILQLDVSGPQLDV